MIIAGMLKIADNNVNESLIDVIVEKLSNDDLEPIPLKGSITIDGIDYPLIGEYSLEYTRIFFEEDDDEEEEGWSDMDYDYIDPNDDDDPMAEMYGILHRELNKP